MEESVVVLSDIHGVLPALEAVLAEPAVRAADRIVLTGDIAAGPQPAEVLDRLLGLGDRVTWVRGNADRELAELARGLDIEVPDEISGWAAKQLSADHVDRLMSPPLTQTLAIAGFGQVLFCHATPRNDTEVVVVDSRLDRWSEVLADIPDEVTTVVCGHTHMPFARLANRRQIVNPGSVGMPYGRAGAHWALLRDGTVEMRRTPYDVAAACAAIEAASTFAGVAEWTDYFLNSRASDADALAVMAPRDGRLRANGESHHPERTVLRKDEVSRAENAIFVRGRCSFRSDRWRQPLVRKSWFSGGIPERLRTFPDATCGADARRMTVQHG
jgi:putative phosphoesterase